MKVKELIELLKRSPAENIVYVEDKALEQSAGVDDVFIGTAHAHRHGHCRRFLHRLRHLRLEMPGECDPD